MRTNYPCGLDKRFRSKFKKVTEYNRIQGATAE